MTDTSSDTGIRYRAMLMQWTGEERFIMGCDMRDTFRAFIEASLREHDPNATAETIRKGLFFASTDMNSILRLAPRLSQPLSEQRIPWLGR
ncbi:MAG: hypothetical protein LZF86_220050 [Nitrospira sp.]|nr:MAG: hypothetical protein LZF86_220050 [Nitrospira sp.]